MRLLAAAAIILIAGCASTPSGPSLAGSEWRVSIINGQPTPENASNYRMAFKASDLSAQFGCNHIGGTYRLSGDTLATSGTAMTEMACIGVADELEGQGLAVLNKPMLVRRNSDTAVVLSNDAGEISLEKR